MSDLLFVLGAGFALLILQTTSLGFTISPEYKPDLALILVVWAALRMDLLVGAGFAFMTGMTVDMLSGSHLGLFALMYCAIFLACGRAHTAFQVDSPMGRAIMAVLGCFVAGSAVAALRWVQGPPDFGWNALLWLTAKPLITGAGALLVFPALDRLHSGYSRIAGSY
ncbi:MAG: rod shape-determining protein MreD [Deltaproteobacteria bacterium]|nr:rod shape-determining protein MreD [Deltaproteobacteria bacterium]